MWIVRLALRRPYTFAVLALGILIAGVASFTQTPKDIFPEIKICTQYELSDGRISEEIPYEVVNEKIKPIYAALKGWNVPLTNLSENQMPEELLNYVSFLEKALGVPITLISTGPDRSQTIHRVAKTI